MLTHPDPRTRVEMFDNLTPDLYGSGSNNDFEATSNSPKLTPKLTPKPAVADDDAVMGIPYSPSRAASAGPRWRNVARKVAGACPNARPLDCVASDVGKRPGHSHRVNRMSTGLVLNG